MAAPRPTLGHSQGDSLTNPMLITAFFTMVFYDGYDANKNGTQEVEIAIPLKYIGNFWRALNIPLIICEVSLELKWKKIA